MYSESHTNYLYSSIYYIEIIWVLYFQLNSELRLQYCKKKKIVTLIQYFLAYQIEIHKFKLQIYGEQSSNTIQTFLKVTISFTCEICNSELLYIEISYEYGKVDMPWSSKLYSQAKDSKLYHLLKGLPFLDHKAQHIKKAGNNSSSLLQLKKVACSLELGIKPHIIPW